MTAADAKPSPSWATSEATRRSMKGNKARDTKPELAVRRRLHAQGFRYRVDVRPSTAVLSRADIVFTRQKIAVFMDGCFWHGCPLHATSPKANADYWGPKLKANIERDARTSASLRELGWEVLRYWEHQPVDEIVEQITCHWAERNVMGREGDGSINAFGERES